MWIDCLECLTIYLHCRSSKDENTFFWDREANSWHCPRPHKECTCNHENALSVLLLLPDIQEYVISSCPCGISLIGNNINHLLPNVKCSILVSLKETNLNKLYSYSWYHLKKTFSLKTSKTAFWELIAIWRYHFHEVPV